MEKFTNYFSNAWGDLTQEKGWWKPVLVLALVNCIPIVGQIVVSGYLIDWAKEASWGLRKPFTREMGDLGRRFKYGLFAIVIMLVWLVPVQIVMSLCRIIPLVGGFLALACEVVYIIAAVVANVAVLRAVTYERIAPGLQIGRILKMAGKDAGGLLRCFCISLIGALIVLAVLLVVVLPLGLLGAFVGYTGMETMGYDSFGYGLEYGYTGRPDLTPFVTAFIAALPLLLIVGFVCIVVQTLFNMLTMRAYGYWLGQFKPAQWGRAEDPMPFERETGGQAWQQPYGAGFAGQPGAWGPEANQQPGAWNEDVGPNGWQQPEWPGTGGAAGADVVEGTQAADDAWATSQGGDATASDAWATPQDAAIVPAVGASDAQEPATDPEASEEVGTVKPEETVGDDDDAPTGWRSATNTGTEE